MAVVGALALAELTARVVGPELPRVAGTDEESVLKAGDMEDRAGQTTEVVFLGASETAAGLLPGPLDQASARFTGAYNAALRGASPATNEAWSRRVVVPRLHPEVAVVGLLPAELAVLDGEAADFADRSDASYASAIDEVDPDLLGRVEDAVADRSALVRHRTELRRPTLLFDGIRAVATGNPVELRPELDPAVVRAKMAATGESLEYAEVPEVAQADPELGRALDDVARGRFDLDHLEDLLRSLQAEGVDPVLATAPTDRTLLAASGVDLAAFDAVIDRVEALADRLGVPVVDGFRADYPTALFHDKQHLATPGAQRWSAEVGAALDRLCAAGRLPRACPPAG